MGMYHLPVELELLILKQLHMRAVLNYMLTCKLFYSIGSVNIIWENLISTYMKKYHPDIYESNYKRQLTAYSDQCHVTIHHLLINSILVNRMEQPKKFESINKKNKTTENLLEYHNYNTTLGTYPVVFCYTHAFYPSMHQSFDPVSKVYDGLKSVKRFFLKRKSVHTKETDMTNLLTIENALLNL